MAREILSNVQVLRFVAATSVLVSHAGDLLIPHASAFWRIPWGAGVDLFFVISGFIMAWLMRGRFGEPGAAGGFLLRRAIRIVPPYWFFTTLMIAVVILAGSHVHHTRLDPIELATSYGFVPWPRPSDGKLNPLLSQGWTLNYEAFFYAAFAAALLFRRGLLWLVLGFAALAAAHPWIPDNLFVLDFWSKPIILEFLAGIGLAELYSRGVRLPLWVAALAVLLALGAFLPTPDIVAPMLGRAARWGLAATLIAAAFILARAPQRRGRVRRALEYAGDASYTLYLSHTFTINAALIAWRKWGLDLPWAGVAFGIAAAIAAALLFYRFVEAPATDALQRRFGLRPARGAQTVAP